MQDAAIVSTAALPENGTPEETFEHWRLAVASLFEARPADANYRTAFRARLVTHNLGHFLIGASDSSAFHTRRDEGLVSAVGIDHILLQLYVRGQGEFAADGLTGRIETGDIVCFDLSRPHSAMLSPLGTVSMVLPRVLIHLSPRLVDEAHGTVIPGKTAMGVLIGQQLSALAASVEGIRAEDIAPATRIASSIANLALSAGSDGRHADADALLVLTLRSVRAFIESHLADRKLSIDTIGRHFGLSRSALYRIFKPLGGVAYYIRARRLERAALKLGSVVPGRGAVARIAANCGFSSEAAFSKAFRDRYGLNPSEAILQAQGLRAHGPAGVGDAGRNWLQTWLRHLSFGEDLHARL